MPGIPCPGERPYLLLQKLVHMHQTERDKAADQLHLRIQVKPPGRSPCPPSPPHPNASPSCLCLPNVVYSSSTAPPSVPVVHHSNTTGTGAVFKAQLHLAHTRSHRYVDSNKEGADSLAAGASPLDIAFQVGEFLKGSFDPGRPRARTQ